MPSDDIYWDINFTCWMDYDKNTLYVSLKGMITVKGDDIFMALENAEYKIEEFNFDYYTIDGWKKLTGEEEKDDSQ